MAAWPIKRSWTPGDVANMVANPFYAINIDEGLALPHEPLISEDDWVRANVGLIEELGPEAYLLNLLSILKGNYPATDSRRCQSQRRTGTAHLVTRNRPQFPRLGIERAAQASALDEPAPLLFPAMSTSNRPAAGHRPVLVPVGQDPVPRLPCPIATRALAAPVALMLADQCQPSGGFASRPRWP